MIYTSYFGNLKNLPKNVMPVSICAKAPPWYKGLQYKKLAPKYWFFKEWKQNHDNDFYIKYFKKEVLDELDVIKVLNELQVMLPSRIKCDMDKPVYCSDDTHIALVCYEKPSDFCHRHLVAQWLRDNGFWCGEYKR